MSARDKAKATMLRKVTDDPCMDHLREIEDLAAGCIETAIELLPAYNEDRTTQEATRLCNHLLIHLRAIQQELKMFREEQKA